MSLTRVIVNTAGVDLNENGRPSLVNHVNYHCPSSATLSVYRPYGCVTVVSLGRSLTGYVVRARACDVTGPHASFLYTSFVPLHSSQLSDLGFISVGGRP